MERDILKFRLADNMDKFTDFGILTWNEMMTHVLQYPAMSVQKMSNQLTSCEARAGVSVIGRLIIAWFITVRILYLEENRRRHTLQLMEVRSRIWFDFMMLKDIVRFQTLKHTVHSTLA